MKKLYFLLLFIAAWSLCLANSEEQKNELSFANKAKEKVQLVLKKNAESLPLKSAMEQNHLDSIILGDYSIGYFFYDEKGLLSDYKGYEVRSEGAPILREHQQFEYDNAGRQTLYVQNYYDSFDGWYVLEKTETEYDADGNIVSEIYWSHDNYDAANPYEKMLYEYGDNTMRLDMYEWDENTNDWAQEGYSTSVLEGMLVLSSETFMYDEDLEDFAPIMKADIEYNNEGLETLSTMRIFSDETQNWIVFMTDESTYNSNMQIELERETIPSYNSTSETRYIYEADKLVKKEEYSDNYGYAEFGLSNYWVYEYSGDALHYETYFMSNTSGVFFASSKYEFFYDTSVDPANCFVPVVSAYFNDFYHLDQEYHQYGLLKKVKHNTIYDWDTFEMKETMVADYYYSDQTSVVLSSDASLSTIEVDGSEIAGFSATQYTYGIELPAGTETVPVVSAMANHAEATVTIEQASALPGEASITVTAEDGETIMEYTLTFSLASGAYEFNIDDVEIYPLPCSSSLNVINNSAFELQAFQLVSLDGKTIVSGRLVNFLNKQSIETNALENGMYILTLIFENDQRMYQRIVKN